MNAQHHLHKRKRIHIKHEEYPHPNRWKRYLDYSVYAMGVISPVMTFSQVLQVWTLKSADGLSPATWATYLVSSIVWLTYGVVHKAKPIIISNILFIIATLLILIGIAIF